MTNKKPLEQVIREINIMIESLNDMAIENDDSNAEKILRTLGNYLENVRTNAQKNDDLYDFKF